MQAEELRNFVVNALEDMKALDINVLDVRGRTAITDFIIVASGTSERHVKATAESVAFKVKQAGNASIGEEGVKEGEWALVDLNGVVLHVMQARVRDYYQIEKLWELDPASAEKRRNDHA